MLYITKLYKYLRKWQRIFDEGIEIQLYLYIISLNHLVTLLREQGKFQRNFMEVKQ